MAAPGFGIGFVVHIDSDVELHLSKLEARLSPGMMGLFLEQYIDPYLRQRSEQRFRDEGDDVVGPWLPLAPATQHFRASQGYGASHPINRRTGALENFIVGSPERINVHSLGATYTFPGKNPPKLIAEKMRTAQAGSPSPKTPPRPVLGMNERDLAFTMTTLETYIRSGIGRP